MRPILIYSGTTEGRELAECLSAAKIPCIVCVATEYGRLVMPRLEGVRVREGRLNVEQMRLLAQTENVRAVVDATHPYATEVTHNIKESVKSVHEVGSQAAELAQRLGRYQGQAANRVPYLRLLRETEDMSGWKREKGIHWMADHAECVADLREKPGNILLTTGSKELMYYCSALESTERLFVRVLPGLESLRICEECGISGKQVIAMQGPFSREMNEALIRQFDIRYLVTKESGSSGGLVEKLQAVQKTGTEAYVIESPKEPDGFSFGGILKELEAMTGSKIPDVVEHKRAEAAVPEPKTQVQQPVPDSIEIFLIGIGMGNPENMTMDAHRALQSADFVFGAERMLAGILPKQHPKAAYLPQDILPELEKIRKNCKEKNQGGARIAVLFSGDSGFYSGCRRLKAALAEGGFRRIKIYPGISSVSYLSAACGVSWQDAAIISTHSRGSAEDWRAEVMETIRFHKKTFLLMASVEDVRNLGRILIDGELGDCSVQLGYQLSYPQEELLECTPQQCMRRRKEGLYTCLVQNPSPQPRRLTHGMEDAVFLRDQVPMTKEEVRSAVISKLHLTESAVVYDIGSGTGSIAVEIAARSSRIFVYAIEKKSKAAELIRQNCRKHHTPNVRVIEGTAPEISEELPAPTHAFIGGSSGNLPAILQQLYEKNPRMRVVMTAVSLETAAEMQQLSGDSRISNLKIVQMQVSRAEKMGGYQLLQAENPVYIASFDFEEKQ